MIKTFNGQILELTCTYCKNGEGCDKCNNSGVLLTKKGKELLDFLTPYIEAKAEDVARKLIRKIY